MSATSSRMKSTLSPNRASAAASAPGATDRPLSASSSTSRTTLEPKIYGDSRKQNLTRMEVTVENVSALVDDTAQKVDAFLNTAAKKLETNLEANLGSSSKLVGELKIFIDAQKQAYEAQIQISKSKADQAQREHDLHIAELKLKDELARKAHAAQIQLVIDESRAALKKSQDDATQERIAAKRDRKEQKLRITVAGIFGLSTSVLVITIGVPVGTPITSVLTIAGLTFTLASATGGVFYRPIYNAFTRCTNSICARLVSRLTSCCYEGISNSVCCKMGSRIISSCYESISNIVSGCINRCSNASCCEAACRSTQGSVSQITPPASATTPSTASTDAATVAAAPPSSALLLSPAATTATVPSTLRTLQSSSQPDTASPISDSLASQVVGAAAALGISSAGPHVVINMNMPPRTSPAAPASAATGLDRSVLDRSASYALRPTSIRAV